VLAALPPNAPPAPPKALLLGELVAPAEDPGVLGCPKLSPLGNAFPPVGLAGLAPLPPPPPSPSPPNPPENPDAPEAPPAEAKGDAAPAIAPGDAPPAAPAPPNGEGDAVVAAAAAPKGEEGAAPDPAPTAAPPKTLPPPPNALGLADELSEPKALPAAGAPSPADAALNALPTPANAPKPGAGVAAVELKEAVGGAPNGDAASVPSPKPVATAAGDAGDLPPVLFKSSLSACCAAPYPVSALAIIAAEKPVLVVGVLSEVPGVGGAAKAGDAEGGVVAVEDGAERKEGARGWGFAEAAAVAASVAVPGAGAGKAAGTAPTAGVEDAVGADIANPAPTAARFVAAEQPKVGLLLVPGNANVGVAGGVEAAAAPSTKADVLAAVVSGAGAGASAVAVAVAVAANDGTEANGDALVAVPDAISPGAAAELPPNGDANEPTAAGAFPNSPPGAAVSPPAAGAAAPLALSKSS